MIRLCLVLSLFAAVAATDPAVFTVTPQEPLVGGTVGYMTADGSAVAGLDYQSASGELTFSAGDPAPQAVTVAVTGDAIVEDSEAFRLVLSTGVVGTWTIENDDSAPVPAFAVTGGSAPEGN